MSQQASTPIDGSCLWGLQSNSRLYARKYMTVSDRRLQPIYPTFDCCVKHLPAADNCFRAELAPHYILAVCSDTVIPLQLLSSCCVKSCIVIKSDK